MRSYFELPNIASFVCHFYFGIGHSPAAMNPITGFYFISPEAFPWKLARPMQIPYADYLEHTKSENIGARLWRFPPKSANTWHKHIKAEELYFVLEGIGRMRVGDQTLTIPKHGAVLVGPNEMRQVFNDTDTEVLWLIIAAPENELEPGETFDIKKFWPTDPTQLPPELAEKVWPPQR
jgi:mannose-6-phosphate isomerase-like protein (cupin superfamily)